jgi:hypothetical protein
MPPISSGRPCQYTQKQLLNLWREFKIHNPKGTRAAFSQQVGLSVSRVKALLNNHPSEEARKERNRQKRRAREREKYHLLDDEEEREDSQEFNRPTTGLMFYPF